MIKTVTDGVALFPAWFVVVALATITVRSFVYPLMHIQTTWRVFDTFLCSRFSYTKTGAKNTGCLCTFKQRGTSMPKPLVALVAIHILPQRGKVNGKIEQKFFGNGKTFAWNALRCHSR